MAKFNLILTLLVVYAVYWIKTETKKHSRKFDQRKVATLYDHLPSKGKHHINKGKYYHKNGIGNCKIKTWTTVFDRNRKLSSHVVSTIITNKRRYQDYSRDQLQGTLNKATKLHSIITRTEFVKHYSNNTEPKASRERRDTNKCSYAGSCKNNINKDVPVCYCDSVCKLLNDCCHDNNATENIHPEIREKLMHTSCRLKIPKLILQSRGYVIVSKCPENETGIKLKSMCETNGDSSLPVTGEDGLTYTNKHCAKCHGVNVYRSWNLKYIFNCFITLNDLLNISNSNEILELFENNDCPFEVFPPKGTPRPRSCWDLQIKLENARNRTLCMEFQNPIYAKYTQNGYIWERNEFCPDIAQDDIVCAEPINSLQFGLSMRYMSALFDFQLKKESSSENCIDSEKGSCTFEAVIGNAELEMPFKVLTNGTYDIWVRILALSHSILENLVIPWQTKDPEFATPVYTITSVENTVGFPCLKFSNCFTIDVKLFMTITEYVTLREISSFYSSLRQMKWSYIERDGKEPLNYTISIFDFCADRMDFGTSTLYYGIKLHQFVSILKHQLPSFKCDFIKVPKYLEVVGVYSDEQNDFFNNSVNFMLLNLTCSPYETIENLINMTSKTNKINWSTIQNISTYIIMGISSVFLLITVILHRYLKLSMNTSGIVSEHFMISMLLSHLFFMFGFGANDYFFLCFVIGTVLHYSWLSCFAWMTMYGVILLKAMLKLKENPNISMTTRFPIYNYVIGYGVPLFVVIPSVVLDIFTDIKIGYATDVCFPSNYPYNIIVFIGPVSFSLMVNAFAMIVASYLIYKCQLSIENNSSVIDSRSYWPVYLRFFIFSGVSWSLGIIAEATDQDILRLFFIFLSGSHGFLFSVSILISKQVKIRMRSFKEASSIGRNSQY